MLHDPNIFAEPHLFDPERWFSPTAPAYPIQAFGFGARLCPGRFFARRSMWAAITGILASFKIVPTEDGPPEKIYLSGMISCVRLIIVSWNGPRAKLIGGLVAMRNHSDAISARALKLQFRWFATPKVKKNKVVAHLG